MHVHLCVCATLQLLREYRFNFFSGVWRAVYCVWMCRMLLGPGGWVLDGYLVWGHGNQISLVVDPRRSYHLKTSKSWTNNKHSVIRETLHRFAP